jgi:hypothetical protein
LVLAPTAVPVLDGHTDTVPDIIGRLGAPDPPRPLAAEAFSTFFLGAAREVYSRYGFAIMDEAEFGKPIRLE